MRFVISENDSVNETIKKCKSGDTIYLKNGIYNEKIILYKDNINIIGEDKDKTIITNHDFFHKIMFDYNECNTFRTYTLYISGNCNRLSNLTVINSSTPSNKYGQAVALYVDGDSFVCEDVRLISAQDTLFTGPLPKNLIERHQGFLLESQLRGAPSVQYYNRCYIEGDVDFIFGCATALFNECTIHSIKRNAPGVDGYISAPSHYKETEYGYLFYKCNLTADDGVNDVYLARPWRDYGSSTFIECNIGKHINPLGYDKWGNSDRDKTARFSEYSPNADTSNRVKWAKMLSKADADRLVNYYFTLIKNKNCRNF